VRGSATRCISAIQTGRTVRSAWAEQAKLLIVVLDHPEDVLGSSEVARRAFPPVEDLRAGAQPAAGVPADGSQCPMGWCGRRFYSSLKMRRMPLLALGISPEDAVRVGDIVP